MIITCRFVTDLCFCQNVVWLWEAALYLVSFQLPTNASGWLRDWVAPCITTLVLISLFLLEEPSGVGTPQSLSSRYTWLSGLPWRHTCQCPSASQNSEAALFPYNASVEQNVIVLWTRDKELFRSKWIQQQDSMTGNLQRREELWKEKIKWKEPTPGNWRRQNLYH